MMGSHLYSVCHKFWNTFYDFYGIIKLAKFNTTCSLMVGISVAGIRFPLEILLLLYELQHGLHSHTYIVLSWLLTVQELMWLMFVNSAVSNKSTQKSKEALVQ